MLEKGIKEGVEVERVGREEFDNQPFTTKGRNRGQNKGQGFGENQVFIKVKEKVINLGQGEAEHIFVRLNVRKMKK